METELIILGCGGSAGVPAIGNWWGACDPSEPRNIRTRPSIALRTQNTLVIVDTGPDFREQMNRERLGCPDAVLITHAHFDHINGLDELRTLQRVHKGREFPLHALPETMGMLRQRLDYMFISSENGFYPTVCIGTEIDTAKPIIVGDIEMRPFVQQHGSLQSLGLRVGNIGYSTDVKKLDETAIATLKGIDVWIVDAAAYRHRENKVHMSIDEIIETNEKIGAGRVILTHLPPIMDYQTLRNELPKGFEPAYDGMRF